MQKNASFRLAKDKGITFCGNTQPFCENISSQTFAWITNYSSAQYTLFYITFAKQIAKTNHKDKPKIINTKQ